MDIKFKTKEATESRTVQYDLPTTVEGLVERFGEENTYEFAKSAIVIALQALARRNIDKSDEEIQAIVNAYDPDTRATPVKQSPEERAKSAISKLSPEQKAALLAQLQGE